MNDAPFAAQAPVDRRQARRLSRPQIVGRLVASARLRLEVVHDHEQLFGSTTDAEHRCVAREQAVVALHHVRVARVAVIDVALDLDDRPAGGRQQADVDAPEVVAIDEHHVAVAVGEHRLVEAHERRPVLGFDDGEHPCGEILDHLRRHADRHLVDRLDDQLEPSDPVGPAGCDDLDARRPPLDHEIAAVLPQDRQLRRLVRLADQSSVATRPGDDLQRLEIAKHLALVGLPVEAPLGRAVEPLEGGELGSPFLPRRGVQHLGAGEQVLDVERRQAHGRTLSRRSPRGRTGYLQQYSLDG